MLNVSETQQTKYAAVWFIQSATTPPHKSIAFVPVKRHSLAVPVCDHAIASAQHLWLLNYRAMSLIVRSWLLNHFLNTIPTCAMRRNISAPCVPVCFPRLQLKVSKKLRNAHLHPRATNNPPKPANCWPSPLS